MPPKAGYCTTVLHAADIPRSLRFYGLLGFETIATEGPPDWPGWARMHCEGGAIMFLLEEPGHPATPNTMLYLYTPDLPGLCQHLAANGVSVPAVSHPPYMPSGEINLRDPDGNFIIVAHWGKPEQEKWEQRLEERKRASSS
jgi:catechol 2,3-dioxygenase-like lactoylglutathione lyase family enzyme